MLSIQYFIRQFIEMGAVHFMYPYSWIHVRNIHMIAVTIYSFFSSCLKHFASKNLICFIIIWSYKLIYAHQFVLSWGSLVKMNFYFSLPNLSQTQNWRRSSLFPWRFIQDTLYYYFEFQKNSESRSDSLTPEGLQFRRWQVDDN